MPRWQRVYVAWCSAVAAYSVAYAAVDFLRLPRVYHFQIERTFRITNQPGGPLPSGYVGLWLWAIVAGAAVGLLAWAVTWRSTRPLGPRGLGLAAAWALTAVALAGAYYTWNNWP